MEDIKDPEQLVEEYKRVELNKMAKKVGIDKPGKFPRKTDVAKEIVRAKKARKYAKKPTGLYFKRE
ncbi:MAG: hypothetical protein ACLFVB_04025 [Thermoplasmata archaeon]